MSPTNTEATSALRVSRLIKADREAVFRAWTDPEQLKRWFGPEGTTISLAEVDLSVGGRYRIRVESTERKRHTASGIYEVIDPPARLAFTWNWEEDEFSMPEASLVTVELRDADGGTHLEIIHERLPSAEAKEGHGQGWESSLNSLEELLA